VLRPLGTLFGAVATARRALYEGGWRRRTRLASPVISVGNLSVGGTGKTPVVARVARLLSEAGQPVAILSRGYGGRFRGEALVVSDGGVPSVSAREAGDEPLMLARDLPGVIVAVGRRRDRVGAYVERRFGRRVFVLDDGFQHLRLHRDLDIVCVDALDPDRLPLPAGRLREPLAALRSADLVLLTQAHRVSEAALSSLEEQLGRERTFRVSRRGEGFRDLGGQPRPAPQRPFLLSGIACPERFEHDVAAWVGAIAGSLKAPDHHRFQVGELRSAAARARELGADAIVTTAKDAARLEGTLELDPPLLVFVISVQIQAEPRLRQRLLSVAQRAAA
jgi:tetraacyldisaccharide 4'-kinase